jgi:uncharacterized protein YkwD
MNSMIPFRLRFVHLAGLILLFTLLLPVNISADAPQIILADPPRMPAQPSGLAADGNIPAIKHVDAGCTAESQCVYLPQILNAIRDPRNRQYAVDLYETAYLGSSGVSTGWNGDIANCIPGNTTQAFQDSVLLRLNYFRQMAGLSKLSGFNAAYNTQDQAAALMMAANQALNHTPPTTWKCYTQTGYNGSSSSNLAIGAYGSAAISLYMNDPGTASLGHRRWILFPQTQEMGSGDISGSTWQNQTNALKAWDTHIWEARPATLDDFVAWPPAAFIPYQVVYPVWSFAVAGADFSNAAVTVTSNGVAIAVQVSHPQGGFGENTLAFKACNCSTWPKPTTDTLYDVTIKNVGVNGVPRDYSYSVTVIDPAR